MSDEVEKLKKELDLKQGTINGFLAKIQELDGEMRRLTSVKASQERKLEDLKKSRDKAVAKAARLTAQTTALVELASAYREIALTKVVDGDLNKVTMLKDLNNLDNMYANVGVVALLREINKRRDEPDIAALIESLREEHGVLEYIKSLTWFNAGASPLSPFTHVQEMMDEDRSEG